MKPEILHFQVVEVFLLQENIVPAEAPQPIQHPLVSVYFTEFRDGVYVPTYTLRSQFPQQPF